MDRELERHGGRRAGLIAKNVAAMLDGWGPDQQRYRWIDRIANRGGLTLEVACGWGGGNAPLILAKDPAARILMNDLGYVVLEEWRQYISDGPQWPGVGLAHFDATDCPIQTGAVDTVSSSGGIANIANNGKALREAYRILTPGGKLFMSDIDVDPESFNQLPPPVREQWQREHNDLDIGTGYEQRLRKVGFIVNSIECSRYNLDPQESTLAELGAKHGIKMGVIGYQIEAEKE
ncbi:MAG TPA: methyltransferase domain-containing protein [Candidatus Edwardsbacteria bacterium]|nr:methyltransferase domain-containing protein [Candidatus Edwardsbacteria bacterium]